MDWSLIVEILLLLVVVWYAIETQKLRRQSEGQLKVLRDQFRVALIPYLEVRPSEFQAGGSRLDKAPVRVLGARYQCIIFNLTDRLAHHVHAMVYDGTGQYYWSEEGAEAIRNQEDKLPTVLSAKGPLSNREEIVRRVKDVYGQESEELLEHLKRGAKPLLAVFFRDANEGLHLVIREFELVQDRPVNFSLSRRYSSREASE